MEDGSCHSRWHRPAPIRPIMPWRDGCFQIDSAVQTVSGLLTAAVSRQDIAAKLEHPGHRRRMALVCRAWNDATPIASYNVMMRPWQSLTALDSRLAVITARHTHLTALNFRCGLVRRASRHWGWHLNSAPALSPHHTRRKTAVGAAPVISHQGIECTATHIGGRTWDRPIRALPRYESNVNEPRNLGEVECLRTPEVCARCHALALHLRADVPTAMTGTSSPRWPRWHWKRPLRQLRACRV